jgi:hypothetical protein
MEQRRLRLGDILDDYCPRERRVTNHAIVAMIEDDIKQTRCTTCDAEHPYKGGKAPRRRKKDTPGTLYKEVLAGMPDSVENAPLLTASAPDDIPPSDEDEIEAAPEPADAPSPRAIEVPVQAAAPADVPPIDVPEPAMPDVEEGPVHRPLIRATLPRVEGQKDPRLPPEFTIRQSGGRGDGNFRGGDMRTRSRGGSGGSGGAGANGNRGGGSRFAGARQGQGQGHGQGHGRGQASRSGGGFRPSQQPRHGGKKRSR